MNKFLNTFLEILQIFLFALAIVIPVRYFLFQPFFVSGASMEPNFESREYLLIDEISYKFKDPARGEVVIFKYPEDPSVFFIKRIVGLPGETIKISDGKVKIYNLQFPEGKILEEPYIEDQTEGNMKVSLKNNEYFVLGDNRNHSSDSRSWGPVPRENIIGRAWISIFPSKGIQLLTSPSY
jgi:signal peptidase I